MGTQGGDSSKVTNLRSGGVGGFQSREAGTRGQEYSNLTMPPPYHWQLTKTEPGQATQHVWASSVMSKYATFYQVGSQEMAASVVFVILSLLPPFPSFWVVLGGWE